MTSCTRRLFVTVPVLLLIVLLHGTSVTAQRAVGACCFSDGTCELTTGEACDEKGGSYLGLNTTCDECTPECDDGNPCTEDSWNGLQCIYEPLDCSDGDACTDDSCIDGVCIHEEIICDDGSACTTDACVEGTCVYTPIDCDDGDACTDDSCIDGVCVHKEMVCDDGSACTTDACVEGTCVYTPIDCDDGDACTDDSCIDGVCVHEEMFCDDGNPCTTDTCVKGTCVYTPIDCDDGDACTDDSCIDGVCVSEETTCNDDNPCTTDTCVKGTCVYTSIDCDDGDPCTMDACISGTCSNQEQDCDDGDSSTSDTCQAGRCVHSPVNDSDEVGEPSPIVWFIDEAPWGEAEKDLHMALCKGAAAAGAELRSLIYHKGRVATVDRLLRTLPDSRRPNLILCSRDTINRIEPGETSGILFLDIEAFAQAETTNTKIVGLPGAWADWADPGTDVNTRLGGLESFAAGSWDPGTLLDPFSALEDILAARESADQESEAVGDEIALAEVLLPAGNSCRLVIMLSETGFASESIQVRCDDSAEMNAKVVAPTSRVGDSESLQQIDGNGLSRNWALRWFIQNYSADPEQDETWQRIKNGEPLENTEEILVAAFREWLTANGHGIVAEWIGNGLPLSEDSIAYAVRFAWFRESVKQLNPTDLPWWLLWASTVQGDLIPANPQALEVRLLWIVGQINGETGELSIDFIGN